MASGGSVYLENAILTQYLITNPGYVSLHTGSAAAGGNEVSGGGYVRQTMAFTLSGSQPMVASNNAITDFPTATAPWGVITAVGIWSAASGGNLLWYGDVATSQGINVGDVARFNANSLTVSCS